MEKEVLCMKLETAEQKHIERIAAISKAAFDSDVAVGAPGPGGPPEYDSIVWHTQIQSDGHLLQAIVDDEIVGGAILFIADDPTILYVARIFIDPVYHRKGYGISLMKLAETFYPGIRRVALDTPLWNVRTNAFYQKLGYSEYKRDDAFAYYQKDLD